MITSVRNLDAALAIQGWMKPVELRWLAEQASRARLVVEVGSWKGRSTRALGENVRGCVFAVDTWAGQADDSTHVNRELAQRGRAEVYGEFLRNVGDLIAARRVIPVESTSIEAAEAFTRTHGLGVFDLVFLDGEHGYEGVRADIAAYLPLVRPGGLMAGHDFPKPGVRRAVLERFKEVSTEGAIWWCSP